MKKILGKTDDVDDALKRLDVLTKEENLMTAARTLEVAQHADDKITIIEEVLQDVNGNVRATQEVISDTAGDVKETKVLAHHVDDNVTVIKELTYELRSDADVIKGDTRSVSDNIKLTNHGAHHFSVSTDTYPSFLPYTDLAMDQMQRSLLLTLSSFIIVVETCSQGICREINFEHGSLLRILPSTIILHVAPITTEQQSGLSEVVHSKNG
jgi:hypothetical protein